MTSTDMAHSPGTVPSEHIALVDLLDRVLATGVVISGEVIISIADVDLVRLSLQAFISSVRAAAEIPQEPEGDTP